MKNTALFACMLASLIWVPPGHAQDPEGPNHPDIPNVQPPDLVRMFKLQELRTMGLSVFSTPFNKQDGLGDGPTDGSASDPIASGNRPTLQGNGTFLRVNGLDAQSCNECHGVVRHSTRPPTLGIGGTGGVATNAVIMPSLIDVADSADDRVEFSPGHDPLLPLIADGVTDYNGRFSNPPFLFGGGGLELLAKEMTMDLQLALEACISNPGTSVNLQTSPGTNFGTIVCAGETVDLSRTEGIVPRKNLSVLTDVLVSEARELLVVRPFGRKGENFSMRDFDRGATRFHFGIQPVEVVGEGIDEDGDGVTDEVTVAEMTALHIFEVTNPRPYMETLGAYAQAGFQTFMDIGCADCHRPELITESHFLPLAHPEEPTKPWANVYLEIDLRKQVGKNQNEGFEQSGTGVVVPLFSDLKRHDMGPRLEETFERGEISNREFITARLWGIADTGPYLHDARATTVYDAIEFHGGEAQQARDLFINNLTDQDQRELLYFLRHLRTPENPNGDIAAILARQ